MADLFSSGAFWIALAFIVFVAATWRPVGRMIGGALDGRADKIREQLEEAVRLREAARQDRQAAEALEASLKRREEQVIERIARAEQEALDDVRAAAVDVAVRATRKLLAETLDAEGHAALIDAAIADLDKRLH